MALVTSDRAGAIAAKPARLSDLGRHERRAAWLFLLPNLIGFVVFTSGPVLFSLFLGFMEWQILRPMRFAGLDNYYRLIFEDTLFHKVLWNTAVYTFTAVPLGILCSLGLALALNQGLRGQTVYRTMFFMPVVSSMVAVALLWRWLYNPEFGLINYLLTGIGVSNPPQWLSDEGWAMPSIIIMSVWKGMGYNMVIFLAGLQGIPQHLYEAAQVDGANRWTRFRHITIPMLSPTTFFVVVIALIHSFQVFEQALVMTEGGPADATHTLVLFIYRNAFQFFKMGYAAAAAWVLFLIVFLLTMIQVRFQKEWVHYE